MPLPCWASSSRSRRGCLKNPSRQAPRGEPEQVVHALGGLREQRHVGVGAARRDVVGAAVVEVDALALEAGDVGGGVGLHADDRLDPRRLGTSCRTRRRRRRCRGRSSRPRACRARRCAGPARRGGPRRRAWSTRCGRAGGRRSRRRLSSSVVGCPAPQWVRVRAWSRLQCGRAARAASAGRRATMRGRPPDYATATASLAGRTDSPDVPGQRTSRSAGASTRSMCEWSGATRRRGSRGDRRGLTVDDRPALTDGVDDRRQRRSATAADASAGLTPECTEVATRS